MKKEVDIPKQLFEQNNESKKYKFINYVMVDDGVYEHDKHCYCCGGPILSTDIRGEEAEKWVFKEYSKNLERDIESEKTKDSLNSLELLLEISKNRDSEILNINKNNLLYSLENNKPNLSANNSKDFRGCNIREIPFTKNSRLNY